MLNSLVELEQYIRENILQAKQSNGANVYWEVSKNMFRGPDESAYSISVFQENKFDGSDDDEFQLALEEIHKRIHNLILNDKYLVGEERESGFVYSWKSSALDWIKVQITDLSIYLFTFQSGQY
jgi:hypothetical protein